MGKGEGPGSRQSQALPVGLRRAGGELAWARLSPCSPCPTERSCRSLSPGLPLFHLSRQLTALPSPKKALPAEEGPPPCLDVDPKDLLQMQPLPPQGQAQMVGWGS